MSNYANQLHIIQVNVKLMTGNLQQTTVFVMLSQDLVMEAERLATCTREMRKLTWKCYYGSLCLTQHSIRHVT